jgi:hypothetical protein
MNRVDFPASESACISASRSVQSGRVVSVPSAFFL